jgi:hypothetical protein
LSARLRRWAYRLQYQGVVPPDERPPGAFDPGGDNALGSCGGGGGAAA